MKSLIILTILMLLPISISAKTIETTSLLPEVKEIVEIPNLNIDDMDENAFVGLIAIDAPATMEPMVIGKQMVLDTIANYKKAVQLKDEKIIKYFINKAPYYNNQKPINPIEAMKHYCANLADKQCIDKILLEKDNIEKVITNNSLLLKRFKKYIALPYYNIYFTNVPVGTGAMNNTLSQLFFKKAIYSIKDNRIEEGLSDLLIELNFYKRILSEHEKYITNLELSIATQRMLEIYHAIERLIDDPIMQDHLTNPKLIALLTSLNEQEQGATGVALEHTRNDFIRNIYFLPVEQISPADNNKKVDKELFINNYYHFMTPYIKGGKLALPQSADFYQHNIRDTNQIQSQAENLCKLSNIEECWLPVEEALYYNTAFSWLYDTVAYLDMVQIKLLIKQQKIAEKNIPLFLKSLGDKAINPYTKEPFYWDKKNKSLSFKWLDKTRSFIKETDTATIYIDFTN